MFHDQLMDLCRSKWTLQTITYSEQSHYNASFHTHYITRLLYLYGNTRRDLAAGSISAVVVPHKTLVWEAGVENALWVRAQNIIKNSPTVSLRVVKGD